MTALDQAFIKAFSRQDTIPLAVSKASAAPKKAEPTPERPDTERQTDRQEQDSGISLLSVSAVCSAPSPSATPSDSGTAAASTTRAPGSDAIGGGLHKGPMPSVAASTADLLPCDAAWAALETPPKKAPSQPKPPEPKTEPTKTGTGSATVRTVASTEPQLVAAPVPVFTQSGGPGAEIADQKTEVSSLKSEISSPQPPISSPLPAPTLVPPASPLAPPSTAALPEVHELKPVWQVEQFTWPRLCRRLISRAAEELDRLADAILAANNQGRKVLAIAGCRRGEGATTMLLCAARRLAERGVKPVLVDADLGRPRLAKRLGVQPQMAWAETSEAAGRTLDQAMFEATASNVVLVPARDPEEEHRRSPGDPSRLPACLRMLRNQYDLVLVDLGPLENAQLAKGARGQLAAEIDAVILVHNYRITPDDQQREFEKQLAADGIVVAGIVENFVTEE
jgi:Mrp family chromosome partitioning ATPase